VHSGKQSRRAIHKECAHFSNGFCTVKGIAVAPEQPACPDFTPKDMMISPWKAEMHRPAASPSQIAASREQKFYDAVKLSQSHYGAINPHMAQDYVLPPQFIYKIPKRGVAAAYSMMSGRRVGGAQGTRRSGGGRGRGRMGRFAAGRLLRLSPMRVHCTAYGGDTLRPAEVSEMWQCDDEGTITCALESCRRFQVTLFTASEDGQNGRG
jgi:hypothetical protein